MFRGQTFGIRSIEGDSLPLKGEADLGMLAGGIYTYEGQLNSERFECTYRCKYDHETFHLKPLK